MSSGFVGRHVGFEENNHASQKRQVPKVGAALGIGAEERSTLAQKITEGVRPVEADEACLDAE